MKKKVLSLLLAAAMVVGVFAGCGGSDAENAAPPEGSEIRKRQYPH